MENISFKKITEIEECKNYWHMFSPNATLFDLWDFRYCFYKYDNFPLEFIVGFIADKPIGLLPLQLNTEKGNYLEFFGGSWMEDNKVFIDLNLLQYVGEFYKQITGKAKLIGINSPDHYTLSLPIDDYKYQLDLTNYTSYWDYVKDKHSKKRQDNFKREFRQIEQNTIEFVENDPADIELLFKFNILNFKEDSSFNNEKRKSAYRDFLNLGLDHHLIVIKINGVKQAVTMNIAYNGIFYYLNSGANHEEIPNLGSYNTMHDIARAIELRCKTLDALMISYNWKERWHLNKIPFYKFENNI